MYSNTRLGQEFRGLFLSFSFTVRCRPFLYLSDSSEWTLDIAYSSHVNVAMVMLLIASMRVRLSVYLSVHALTFESLDLKTSFLVCRYVFGASKSSSYFKVIGSRSRSQQQRSNELVVKRRWSAFG